jgi:hypothetical protein
VTAPKRGPGRPPLPPEQKRERRVSPSFTDKEYALLEARAEFAGVSIAEFVRLSALGTLWDGVGGGAK